MKKSSLTEAALAEVLARALAVADGPFQDMDFPAAELDYDFSATPPVVRQREPDAAAVTRKGTRKISIRVSNRVLNAIQGKAQDAGIGYQTYIKRMLNDAITGG